MFSSLRVRLLGLVFAGVAALTLAGGLVRQWSFEQIRTNTVVQSSNALQDKSTVNLERLAVERATAVDQILGSAEQIAIATSYYLANAPLRETEAPLPTMQETSFGRRYHQTTGATTVIVPPNAGPDALDGVQTSERLNSLLPGLMYQLPVIWRISYMAPGGVLRTHPSLNPALLNEAWSVESNPIYIQSRENVLQRVEWIETHPSLDGQRQVISAIVPVTRFGIFRGGVEVEVSLNELNAFLQNIVVERSGFSFVVDAKGQLIVAPVAGQQLLIGRPLAANEAGSVMLPNNGPIYQMLFNRAGRTEVGSGIVTIDAKEYLLVYAPIARLGWSSAILVPLNEITAESNNIAIEINKTIDRTRLLDILISLGLGLLLMLTMAYALTTQLTTPLQRLIKATNDVASGNLHPIPITRNDELGHLTESFNAMTVAVEHSRVALVDANQGLEQTVAVRTAELAGAVQNLEESLKTQKSLLQTLHDSSTPVIPVIKGVLAMPLIGQIDDQRAQNALETLLDRIIREHARVVLLDITGVPMIDTAVAQALLRTVEASQLLGARVVLVGVSPEVAQTIVALGIDMRKFSTAADMRTAIEHLLSQSAGGIH